LYTGREKLMPENKHELIDTEKYNRKGELTKAGKARSAGRRSMAKISEAKIVAKPDKGERRGHWPPW
jgi:hypothetical protein